MSQQKPIPKKLQEELALQSRYKPGIAPNVTVNSLLGQRGDSLELEIEKAMYDEILGPSLSGRAGYTPSNVGSYGKGSNISQYGSRILELTGNKGNYDLSSQGKESNGYDNYEDFNTTILARLAKLEDEAKSLRAQVATKSKRIEELEIDNREFREKFTSSEDILQEMKLMKRKNQLLSHQIQEMETFLEDYGLVWVGGEGTTSQEMSEAETIVDFNQFALKIKELNDVIANEPTQIVHENKQARFVSLCERLPHIKVAVYQNGILINNGPFRHHTSDSYKTFVTDIIDGYFPSEYKDSYPDGVIFDLLDRHTVDYDDSTVPSTSAAELINKLPNAVIRNGEVISIREDIAKRLQSKPAEVKLIQEMPSLYDNGNDLRPATIMIKWIDGVQLKVKANQTDTIHDIRRHILAYISTSSGIEGCTINSFELRTAFPKNQSLSDNMTLLEADLVPNGKIFAQRIK